MVSWSNIDKFVFIYSFKSNIQKIMKDESYQMFGKLCSLCL